MTSVSIEIQFTSWGSLPGISYRRSLPELKGQFSQKLPLIMPRQATRIGHEQPSIEVIPAKAGIS